MAVHCQCYPVFFLLSKGFFLWIRATDTSNLGWMVYRRLPACMTKKAIPLQTPYHLRN
jgi:hypothetical protein